MAGAGSFIGGHLGNYLAGRTSGGKLSGGKFFQGSRGDLASQIKEGIGTSALKSFLTSGLKHIKSSGGKLGDFFKSGDKAPGQTGFGSLIDYKGSAIGKGLESSAARKLAEKSTRIDEMLAGRDTLVKPSFEDVMSSGRTSLTERTSKTQELTDFLDIESSISALGPSEFSSVDQGFEIRRSPAIDAGWQDPSQIKDPGFEIPGALEGPSVGIKGTDLSVQEWLQKQKTEKLWDLEKSVGEGAGSTAVEGLLGSETGTGFTPYEERLFDPALQQPNPSLGLQQNLRTGKRLNLYPRLFPGD